MKIVGIDPGTNRIGYASLVGDRHRITLIRAATITIPIRLIPRSFLTRVP